MRVDRVLEASDDSASWPSSASRAPASWPSKMRRASAASSASAPSPVAAPPHHHWVMMVSPLLQPRALLSICHAADAQIRT